MLLALCFLGCLLFQCAAVFAQSSATSISFQGVLNQPNGALLMNGAYNLIFRFYASAATNGTVNGNAVTNGVVSTAIPVQPAWFDGPTRWLGISVNGAVIGKAMTELAEGRGLVLVLVNLQ